MSAFYRLRNTLQRYDWGSTSALQGLLGLPEDGGPAAELWMGAHPKGPSLAVPAGGGEGVCLGELVRSAPEAVLGARAVEEFGPRLPYLLKLLAADKALSLQVHPQPHRARAGFNAENRRGLAADSPERSFLDDQHKPEMVVAITRFEGLSGFRRPRRILELLDGLAGDLVGRMREALSARTSTDGVRDAFTLVVHARTMPDVAADLARTVADLRARLACGTASPRADETAITLAEQHPGDPGALVSLMLNRVTLEPGESMFVPAGHVHAYLSGCAVEIMASSDNVLRAGLTTKRVDVEALLACASFAPGPAVRPRLVPAGGGLVGYSAPIREFRLTYGRPGGSRPVALAPAGPRIVVVVEGTVTLAVEGEEIAVRAGESVFVPHDAGPLSARGSGLLAFSQLP